MPFQFSDAVSQLQPSAIREILKFTSMPGVISLAAGNPAPEAFPTEAISEIAVRLLQTQPIAALQYNITEGDPGLRQLLKQWMTEKHCFSEEQDELIVTSGAQQANELSCKVMLNPGETLLCESPSFIGSLNAFKSYGVNLVGIPMEEDGMNLDALEQALQTQPNCKLLYLIPNFQNPTGRVTSLEKRKAIYALACKYNIVILEDDPYGELRISGESLPTIKSMDTEGRVLYAGSFSKVLAPGLRVGYLSGPKEILQKVIVCKQVSDVHTNILAQLICAEFLRTVDFQQHLQGLRSIYREKCNLMLDTMQKTFHEKVKWETPEGGLFLWCHLPEECNMQDFCNIAVQQYKIAVVPGSAFLVNETDTCNAIRLNFSTPTNEQIVKGVSILGQMTKELLH